MMVVVSTVLQCTGDEMEFEQVASSSMLDQCLRAGVRLLQGNVRQKQIAVGFELVDFFLGHHRPPDTKT